MRCPVDDAPFREVTRRGVKIDICTECRGVWLDRGELDHLLEAASAAEFDQPAVPRAPSVTSERARVEPDTRSVRGVRDDDDDDDDDDYRSRRSDGRRDGNYPAPERKKSRFGWLSDILEGGE